MMTEQLNMIWIRFKLPHCPRFFLKHTLLEQAFDQLCVAGFRQDLTQMIKMYVKLWLELLAGTEWSFGPKCEEVTYRAFILYVQSFYIMGFICFAASYIIEKLQLFLLIFPSISPSRVFQHIKNSQTVRIYRISKIS